MHLAGVDPRVAHHDNFVDTQPELVSQDAHHLAGKPAPPSWRSIVTETGRGTFGQPWPKTDAAAAQLGHSNEAITQQHYIYKSKVAPDVRQYLQAFSPARAE